MKKILLASVAVLAMSAAAHADTGAKGWYLGGNIGANMTNDADFDSAGVTNDVDYENAATGSMALGYAFQNNMRLELEAAYRNNSVDSISGTGASGNSGEISSYSGILNALYDINTNTNFVPYLGAGAGIANVKAGNIGSAFAANRTIGDNDTVLAYQGIAGVDYKMGQQTKLGVSYRYMATDDLDLEASNGNDVDGEYSNHSILLGVKYAFNGAPMAAAPVVAAAAPAPAPRVVEQAPAPVAAQNFQVFFDFDKSEITPEAQQILRSAAAAAKAGKMISLDVTGHADSSGSSAYNQKLSQRRATMVRNELVRLGVNASEIGVAASGEGDLLVPTGDNVKEAQNRRAVIVLK